MNITKIDPNLSYFVGLLLCIFVYISVIVCPLKLLTILYGYKMLSLHVRPPYAFSILSL